MFIEPVTYSRSHEGQQVQDSLDKKKLERDSEMDVNLKHKI